MYGYNFPTPIKYGPGAIKLLPDILKDEGKRRPLIVTDRGLLKLAPVETTTRLLRDAGLEVAVYGDIHGNPVASQVSGGVRLFREHKADAIVALGGGAALDVAKVIAVMVNHPGEVMEYDAFLPS